MAIRESDTDAESAAEPAERFAFGDNWRSYLRELDEGRIQQAMNSLIELLGTSELSGRRFLDIGCGSGLFSLAARRLGASVVSLDYDPASVACAVELRSRYDQQPDGWEIITGSVLDPSLLTSLGRFDVVYSWGVLHHTGQLDQAIELASGCVAPAGTFVVAIYNDQGGASRRWLVIKRLYQWLPSWLRPGWVALIAGIHECKFACARVLRGKNPLPFADWRAKRTDRGMSAWHDWVDWVGGLPFEVAKPEQVIMPLRRAGFVLERLSTVGGGWGCNEYVFRRADDEAAERS